MDVLYAINVKKGNRLSSMLPGFQGPVTDSTITIAELLDLVNQYFPDVLPEDVLKHYGYDARPKGNLGKDALYSTQETDNISNRDLLANAFETLSRSSVEYEMIQDYRKQIKLQNMHPDKIHSSLAELIATYENSPTSSAITFWTSTSVSRKSSPLRTATDG